MNKKQDDAYWIWIENHFEDNKMTTYARKSYLTTFQFYRDILLDLALLIAIVSGIAIAMAFFGS